MLERFVWSNYLGSDVVFRDRPVSENCQKRSAPFFLKSDKKKGWSVIAKTKIVIIK
jgi:hypothetical protein